MNKLDYKNQNKENLVMHDSDLSEQHKVADTQKQLSMPITRLLADTAENFQTLCENIHSFNDCALKKTAINTVIYDGVTNAKVMLIGEAPGASEDERGIPFCGQSGILLDNILQSVGISRKNNALITNTVFWRPPGNRRPTSDEIELCRPFLEKMIALVAPTLIILVGNAAVESLLNVKTTPMHELRGKNFAYQNKYIDKSINMTAILHPSYLLRQPTQKKAMWFDMLNIINTAV